MSPRSLRALEAGIVACRLCPRLRAHCERVAREKKRAFARESYWGRPVPGYGDPRARLLVVGLAPAAHGANRTGRVFTGDSSGAWLYAALHRHGFSTRPISTGRSDGLKLIDAFVTAAARCAPPGNRPSGEELRRCRPYLEAEVRLLSRVRVVVALGRVAYEAWLKASGWWGKLPVADRPLFAHGSRARLPDGTVFICSYHPSRQNTNTGRLTRRMWSAIFARCRAEVDAGAARGATVSRRSGRSPRPARRSRPGS